MKPYMMLHRTADATEGPQYEKTKAYHDRGAPRKDGSLKWPEGFGIQYPIFVERDGARIQSLELDETTWHSGSQEWNLKSFAVCFAGFEPTKAQVDSIYQFWKDVGRPILILHSDVNEDAECFSDEKALECPDFRVRTSCPGEFPWRSEFMRRRLSDLVLDLKNALKALPRFVGTPREPRLLRRILRLKRETSPSSIVTSS